jgi:hypothetical protein
VLALIEPTKTQNQSNVFVAQGKTTVTLTTLNIARSMADFITIFSKLNKKLNLYHPSIKLLP